MSQLDNSILRKLQRLSNKVTRDKRFLTWNRIKKILFVVDIDEVDIREIEQVFEILSGKEVDVVGITGDKNRQENFPLIFKQKFLWFKFLKSDELQQIINKDYDLAIAYSKNEFWAVALLLAQTKAKCRISAEPALAVITDLTIIPQQMNLKNLLEQTIKYLQTIKTTQNDK